MLSFVQKKSIMAHWQQTDDRIIKRDGTLFSVNALVTVLCVFHDLTQVLEKYAK